MRESFDARLVAPAKAPLEARRDELEQFRAALLRGVGDRPTLGCWLWTRGTAGPGYGFLALGIGRRYAHRTAYQLAHGDLPEGRPLVLHDCDTPLCVRPSHLYAGTCADNMRDMAARRRGRRGVVPLEASVAARESLRAGGARAKIAQGLIDAFGVTRSAAYYHLRPALLASGAL